MSKKRTRNRYNKTLRLAKAVHAVVGRPKTITIWMHNGDRVVYIERAVVSSTTWNLTNALVLDVYIQQPPYTQTPAMPHHTPINKALHQTLRARNTWPLPLAAQVTMNAGEQP